MLGGLADVVAAESVDVVAGRRRRLRPGGPVGRRARRARAAWWRGCAAPARPVVLTPGNHDSARRLGTFSELLAAGGLHVRAETPRARRAGPARRRARRRRDLRAALPGAGGRPPRAGRCRSARSHEAVLAAAMDRVRADLFLRPGARSVVLAHAFVGGGVAERQRARHQRRRRRPRAGRRSSTASTTSRWATCTARRRSRRGCATAARRWPTPSARPGSRSRPGSSTSTPTGLAEVRAGAAARPRAR